tara:strand:- start:732 stop:881 length:150 start_codon:yes stop_codon:yes gene_type:complete
MEPLGAKRLRAFEDENSKLKKLLAEQMLDNRGRVMCCGLTINDALSVAA